MATPPDLLRRLRTAVGDDHVLTDPEVTAGFGVDFTGRFRGRPAAVVRPGSTAEVLGVLRACRDQGAALVPQGGNTGLVGGGVPLHGEVVLSLRRLGAVTDVDAESGQLTAGAGATVAEVQRAAAAAGWSYGVDLASRDSATVGGTVATNAGGLRVLRHGDTRAQVLGVEAVLGTGDVVSHLGGLVKDNTGYHLPSLLCGSEGTLGVVTAARLRLVPAPRQPAVALLALDSVAAAVALVGQLRRRGAGLEAVELFLRPGLELVCAAMSLPAPFPRPHPAYLLVEVEGGEEAAAALAPLASRSNGVADMAVAVGSGRVAALWRYREAHTEAIATLGVPHKLDVTLPLPAMAAFLSEVVGAVGAVAPGAETWLFGHAADGNIHVNVTGVDPGDQGVDAAVFELAARHGGSISAEHGIGTAKRRWLHLNRTPAELSAFRAIKDALDPDGVLNPHVLVAP